MTGTPPHIRWEPLLGGNFDGYVGTRTAPMFNLFLVTPGGPAPWALRSELLEGYSAGTDPDELKAEAKRWLEEFVASLGAVFPEESAQTRRLTEEAITAAAEAIDAEFLANDGRSKPRWARDLAITALEAAVERAQTITVPAASETAETTAAKAGED